MQELVCNRDERAYEEVTCNYLGIARRVLKNGREYIVAPATSLKEGVLTGSKGALFYPNKEISSNPSDWDDKPLTLYHPFDPVTGKHLSAKDKGVLARQGLGAIKKTIFNGKLQHELWFDYEITSQRDKTLAAADRIIPRLLEGRPIELSTGLYTSNKPAPNNANYLGKRYDAVAQKYEPDHLAILPNQIGACILPGQEIQGRIVKASKARYSGEAIRIRTRSGETLSVTANHPILTGEGFIAAGNLTEGQYLLHYVGEDESFTTNTDEDNAPTLAEYVFDTLQRLPRTNEVRRIGASPLDFHGDAAFFKSNVEIVSPKSVLSCNSVPEPTQGLIESDFGRGRNSKSQLSSGRHLLQVLDTMNPPNISPISDGGESLTLCEAEFGIHQVGCLGAVPSDSPFSDPLVDHPTIHPNLLGDLVDSKSTFVEADCPLDNVGRESFKRDLLLSSFSVFGPAAELDVSLPKTQPNRSNMEVELFGQLLNAFPSKVFSDQIVHIDRFFHDGPVYDFESATGYIIAERLIVSNCSINDGCGVLVNQRASNSNNPIVDPVKKQRKQVDEMLSNGTYSGVDQTAQTDEQETQDDAVASMQAIEATTDAARENIAALEDAISRGDMAVAKSHLKAIQQLMKTTEEVKAKAIPKTASHMPSTPSSPMAQAGPPPSASPQGQAGNPIDPASGQASPPQSNIPQASNPQSVMPRQQQGMPGAAPPPQTPKKQPPGVAANAESHGVKIKGDKNKLAIYDTEDCNTNDSEECKCGGDCDKCRVNVSSVAKSKASINATSASKESWIGNDEEENEDEETDNATGLQMAGRARIRVPSGRIMPPRPPMPPRGVSTGVPIEKPMRRLLPKHIGIKPQVRPPRVNDSEDIQANFDNSLELATYNVRWPQHERDKLAKDSPEDFAGPHHSFPIKSQKDVESAIKLRGHADDPNKVASKIKNIAKRKGLSTEALENSETCNCGSPMMNSKGKCIGCGKMVVNPKDTKNVFTDVSNAGGQGSGVRGKHPRGKGDKSSLMSDNANSSSDKAHARTAIASRMGTKGSHNVAERFHLKAADKHQKAAMTAENEGETRTAEAHKRAAVRHYTKAMDHRNKASLVKNESNEETPMTREEAVNYLVDNCSCEREQLNNFSDEALAGVFAASTVANTTVSPESMSDDEITEALQVLVNEAQKRNESSTSGSMPTMSAKVDPDEDDDDDEDDISDMDEETDNDTSSNGSKHKGGNHNPHKAAKAGGKMRGNKVNIPGTQASENATMNSSAVYNALDPQDREFLEMGRRAAQAERDRLVREIKDVVANSTSKATQQAITNNLNNVLKGDKVNSNLMDLLNTIGGPVSNRKQQPTYYGPAGMVVENSTYDEESLEDAPLIKTIDWKAMEREKTLERQGGRPLNPVA